MAQLKSALMQSYRDWPRETGILLWDNARPSFLGMMRADALAIEASANGVSAWFAVFRFDGNLIDKDRYTTFGTPNAAGWVSVRKQKKDSEHHGSALPARLSHMSGIWQDHS